MEFIEAPAFSRYLTEYMNDDEYRMLQTALSINPEAGDIIQKTGGFRKVRWSDPRRRKGKRGGLRVIYYYFPEVSQIWLMTLYNKDEAKDLTAQQKSILNDAINAEKKARGAKYKRGS